MLNMIRPPRPLLTCRCHELIGEGGGQASDQRPCKIPFPQKSKGSGRVVPLSISVHGLGRLVNVCLQVSNNNQTLGLLREVLSQNLPYLKAASFCW